MLCTMWLARFAHRLSVADRAPSAQSYMPPETPRTVARRKIREQQQWDLDSVMLAKDYLEQLELASPLFTEPLKHYRRVFEIIRDLSPAAMDHFVREATGHCGPRALAFLLEIYPLY